MCRCQRRAASALAQSPLSKWKKVTHKFLNIRKLQRYIPRYLQNYPKALLNQVSKNLKNQWRWRSNTATTTRHTSNSSRSSWSRRKWPKHVPDGHADDGTVEASWTRQWLRLWTNSFRSTGTLRGLSSTKTGLSWKAFPNLTSSIELLVLGIHKQPRWTKFHSLALLRETNNL